MSDVVRIVRAAFALEHFKASAQDRTAFWPPEEDSGEGGAVFLSPEMRTLADTATRVAATDVPVLITGETGTGKEVFARLIHSRSPRAKKPFLPFNCATVPREMMDSQLFGHRRGAFTGAIDNFNGVIRSARGGTLLLDEIGDLGLDSQPKLLRFLESGELLPLGESSPVQADVRVIAATNADLDAAVSNGRFREDLYYRLNIIQLRLPPLRQRRMEIPSLCRRYLQMFATQFNKGELRLGEETLERLVLFSWPGNIRQLANEMRRLAALAEPRALLMPNALSPEIYEASDQVVPPQPAESGRLTVRLDQPRRTCNAALCDGTSSGPHRGGCPSPGTLAKGTVPKASKISHRRTQYSALRASSGRFPRVRLRQSNVRDCELRLRMPPRSVPSRTDGRR